LQYNPDRWNPAHHRHGSRKIPIPTFVVVNVVVVLALIALALRSPSASEWISAAAQAEFVGSDSPATTPTQIAQPTETMQFVRSN